MGINTRRIILLCALIVALNVNPVLADLSGTRKMERDNRRCARHGQHYSRNGYTPRELARLERLNCKRSGDTWVSSLYYQAEV